MTHGYGQGDFIYSENYTKNKDDNIYENVAKQI